MAGRRRRVRILAGTFNAIRVDIREQLYIQHEAVDHLREISDNTSHNVYLGNLEEIKNGINSLNDKLAS